MKLYCRHCDWTYECNTAKVARVAMDRHWRTHTELAMGGMFDREGTPDRVPPPSKEEPQSIAPGTRSIDNGTVTPTTPTNPNPFSKRKSRASKIYCKACYWSFEHVTESVAREELARHWRNNHWSPMTQEPQGAYKPPPPEPKYPLPPDHVIVRNDRADTVTVLVGATVIVVTFVATAIALAVTA